MAPSKLLRFFECLALLLVSKIFVVFGTAFFSSMELALWVISCSSYLLSVFSLFRLSKFFFSFELCKMKHAVGFRARLQWRMLLRPLGVLSLFSAAAFVLYVPDTIAAFASEVSLSLSVALTILAWVFVTCLVVPLRIPLLFLSASQKWRLGYVLLLPFLELSLLLFFPLAYFGSLPMPVRPAALTRSASFGPIGFVTVIVDPRFNEEARLRAAQEANDFRLQNTWSFLEQLFAEIEPQGKERVLQLLWPETMFAMSIAGVQTVFSELEKRALQKGFDKLELIAGVGSALENNVIYVARNEVTGRVQFEKLAEKKNGVPAFEKSVFGMSVYAGHSSEEARYNDWNELELRGSRSFSHLQSAEIRICYDALFPSFRKFASAEVVFTNHHVFSRFKIASSTYDYVLRLLSMIFQNDSILVANQGSSGLAVGSGSFWGTPESSTEKAGRLSTWKRP